MNVATSIEQSKKLVELGIDPSTADMHYSRCAKNKDGSNSYKISTYGWGYAVHEIDIPCWSLGALLELMPNCIVNEYHNMPYYLFLQKKNIIYYNPYRVVFNMLHRVTAETTLDAAFDMVVWLKENKYI